LQKRRLEYKFGEGALMKKCIILIITVLYSLLCADMLFAAGNTWSQKADFGGTGRFAAVGFSVEGKGYIGTGWGVSYTNHTQEFIKEHLWENIE
jgi:hypothetical protein